MGVDRNGIAGSRRIGLRCADPTKLPAQPPPKITTAQTEAATAV